MLAQNNIERRRLLYTPISSLRLIPIYFSPIAFSAFFHHAFFFHDSGKRFFLWNAPAKGKAMCRSCSRSLLIFFHLMHLVTNTTCSIRKGPESVRFRFARIFIFHFNLHFSRSTHVHEKARTLGHSCGIHTAGTHDRSEGIYICR